MAKILAFYFLSPFRKELKLKVESTPHTLEDKGQMSESVCVSALRIEHEALHMLAKCSTTET